MTEYELHTQGASQPSDTKRYSLQTDYANGVGIPTMMECPTGDYVLYSHVRALELHNEMLLEMRKAADRQLAEALAQVEAIGAGGVSLMRAQPGTPASWTLTYPQVKALAAELIRAAETMGSEAHDPEYEGEELVLQVRMPGTVSDDDGSVNERPLLAISLFDYPDEGVYPIDPTECSVPTPPAAGQALTFSQWWAAGGHRIVSTEADRCGWKGAAGAGYIAGLLSSAGTTRPADGQAQQDADKPACVTPMSDKPACGAQNSECERQQPDPAMAGDYADACNQILEAITANAAPVAPMDALEELWVDDKHITLDAGLVLNLLEAHAKALAPKGGDHGR